MTVFRQEWKRAGKAFFIWSFAIAFMLAVSIFIFPEMASQAESVSEMMSEMGGFSAAFGLNKINFGSITGYFAIECGNTLGIGGALFAAILGISSLAKEEKEHTAEFLLTHPISRGRVVFEKLLSVFAQITGFHLISMTAALGAIAIIGEKPDGKSLFLLFLSYYLLELVIGFVTFGVSAFLRGNGLGIGMGTALLSYFLNVIANITENTKFLKFFTPFAFAEGADIISSGKMELKYLAVGAAVSVLCVAAAFVQYQRKDISA